MRNGRDFYASDFEVLQGRVVAFEYGLNYYCEGELVSCQDNEYTGLTTLYVNTKKGIVPVVMLEITKWREVGFE